MPEPKAQYYVKITTHYPDCWREHHECAVALIERWIENRKRMYTSVNGVDGHMRVLAQILKEEHEDIV